MELGWGGFDRAKLDMLILIRIPFSFYVLQVLNLVTPHKTLTLLFYRLLEVYLPDYTVSSSDGGSPPGGHAA